MRYGYIIERVRKCLQTLIVIYNSAEWLKCAQAIKDIKMIHRVLSGLAFCPKNIVAFCRVLLCFWHRLVYQVFRITSLVQGERLSWCRWSNTERLRSVWYNQTKTRYNRMLYMMIKLGCYVIWSTRHPEGSQLPQGWPLVNPSRSFMFIPWCQKYKI